VRYLHPLRLYLLTSILFFFAVNYWAKSFHVDNKPMTPKEQAELEEVLKNKDLPPQARTAVERRLEKSKPTPAASASPLESATPEAPATEPSPEKQQPKSGQTTQNQRSLVVFDDNKPSRGFGKWLEQRAREKIGENGINAGTFIRSMLSNLPYMMLCSIPLFALILKILYIRNHVLYIDHLTYALHIHTFFYVATMSIILITIGLNRVYPSGLVNWIIALLWCAFAVQIFLSIRRVYRQGWFRSLVKFFLGGIIYLIVLLAGFFATFIITLAIP
jgi:hypothetical protein